MASSSMVRRFDGEQAVSRSLILALAECLEKSQSRARIFWFHENIKDCGEPVETIDGSCENCEFMFDLTYELTYWYDDGTCGKSIAEPSGRYGYSSDVGEYGSVWMYSVNAYYYAWGYAEFDGSSFEYRYGYANYPYNGSYYTNYQYGYAVLD